MIWSDQAQLKLDPINDIKNLMLLLSEQITNAGTKPNKSGCIRFLG